MEALPREEWIRRTLEDARERAEARNYEPGTVIARVEEFSAEELATLNAEFIIRHGLVILTENPSYLHMAVVEILMLAVVAALNNARTSWAAARYRFRMCPDLSLTFHRVHSCSTRGRKIFDWGIALDPVAPGCPKPAGQYPICGEVALRNENFPTLMEEGEEMMSPWSSVLFCLVFHQGKAQ